MASIDDATGQVLVVRFFPAETSAAYLTMLRLIVERKGIPCSIYQDRHSALKRNDNHWSLQEQLAGRQEPTQVGGALEALGIQAIFALTPQAKGRVERLNRTLQDRLIALMGLDGITDISTANAYVDSGFIDDYNRRFAEPAKEVTPAWRKVPRGLDLDRVISFRYSAVVGQDNAVRLGSLVFDIPPGPRGCGYAKSEVEVRQLLDGRWRIYKNDRLLGEYPATEVVEPLRRRKRNRHAPGADDAQFEYWASALPAEGKAAGRATRNYGGGVRARRIA